MNEDERKFWIAFVVEQRRHYLGIVAACDRIIKALSNPVTSVDADPKTCYDDMKDNDDRVTPR